MIIRFFCIVTVQCCVRDGVLHSSGVLKSPEELSPRFSVNPGEEHVFPCTSAYHQRCTALIAGVVVLVMLVVDTAPWQTRQVSVMLSAADRATLIEPPF